MVEKVEQDLNSSDHPETNAEAVAKWVHMHATWGRPILHGPPSSGVPDHQSQTLKDHMETKVNWMWYRPVKILWTLLVNIDQKKLLPPMKN